jgi:hypothetical protein
MEQTMEMMIPSSKRAMGRIIKRKIKMPMMTSIVSSQ